VSATVVESCFGINSSERSTCSQRQLVRREDLSRLGWQHFIRACGSAHSISRNLHVCRQPAGRPAMRVRPLIAVPHTRL
jgi:hypothetical protein